MSEEVMKSLAKDLAQITESINDAKTLISAMKEAGEDTAKLEADLRSLEIRQQKWKRMLEARGYTV